MSEDIATLFESSSDVAETSDTSEVKETVETGEKESSETETKEAETSEADAKETDETKESKTEPTSTEEENEKQEWTFHAVMDERQKRQDAVKELEEFKSKLKDDDKQVIPDVFEDQEGFVKSLQNQHQEDLARSRIQIFREVQIEAHDDYEEKETKFIELAKANPILIIQMNKASNPAKFVYEQMIKHEQFEEMQDIDTFKDKIRAELKLELETELEEGKSEKAEKTEKLSPSLAKARGSTDKAEKVSDNPVDLFD